MHEGCLLGQMQRDEGFPIMFYPLGGRMTVSLSEPLPDHRDLHGFQPPAVPTGVPSASWAPSTPSRASEAGSSGETLEGDLSRAPRGPSDDDIVLLSHLGDPSAEEQPRRLVTVEQVRKRPILAMYSIRVQGALFKYPRRAGCMGAVSSLQLPFSFMLSSWASLPFERLNLSD